MSFKPNDKVVCINDNWSGCAHLVPPSPGWPVRDMVYVVRDGWLNNCGAGEQQYIALVGIQGSSKLGDGERGFPARKFRLVSEVGHPQVNTHEVPRHINDLD